MSSGATDASDQRGPASGRLADILPIAAVTFVALLGFGAFIPVFPFFGRSLNASDGAVTLTMAAYSLGQFISAPFWGRLSDKYGRKPILIAGTCAAAVAYFFVANAQSIEMLFAARLFGGLMAGNIAAAFAAASDISSPASRAKAMGILGAAFGLGFIIGPALGGQLAGHQMTVDSLAHVAYVAAGMNILAALATVFIFKETLKPEARVVRESTHRLSILAGRRRLQTLTIVSFMVTTAFGMMEATMGFLAADRFGWTPRDLGHLFALVGVLSVIMQGGAIGRLTKMLGETKLLIAGLVIMTIGLIITGFAEVPGHAYLAAMFLSVGSAVTNPTLTTLSSFEASEDERGAVLGVVQSAASLGRVAGPALGGTLYAGIATSAPFITGGIIAVMSAILIALALSNQTPRQRQIGDPST
jgi:MFS transporter, DHA1 family, tetracycline resistance protein